MQWNIPRIVIAATQSGAGKTTLTAGLLAALRARGLSVQSFKVGPDYIDLGYHRIAGGRTGHNLDTWLVPEARLAEIFARECRGAASVRPPPSQRFWMRPCSSSWMSNPSGLPLRRQH